MSFLTFFSCLIKAVWNLSRKNKAGKRERGNNVQQQVSLMPPLILKALSPAVLCFLPC